MPTYNKLVRDKIPAIIASHGKTYLARELNAAEYQRELKTKLQEEVAEYVSAPTDKEAVEELADLLEVMRSLVEQHGATWEQLEAVRLQKAAERGGFSERVYLIHVDET